MAQTIAINLYLIFSHIKKTTCLTPRSRLAGICLILIFTVLAGCNKNNPPSSGNSDPGGPGTVNPNFARGADVSWLTQMESSGYAFYDSTGSKLDCIQILKNLGLNAVRLRAWVNPTAGWCNTTDLVQKAVRANNLGMRVMIDFHYSDTWADPGHQTKPASWSALPFDSLVTTLYNYTFHVMDTLKANAVIPVWVQVGNETNDGMLWEDGRASTNMSQFAALVTAGYQAVKAVDDSTKVIVHVSNGYDSSLFSWLFDGLLANGASWDIIGMSLYPSTSDWQTLDQQCLANMNYMVSRYHKQVMISEIGMDVTAPNSSREFIADIVSKTQSVSGQNGLGVFYWEPECYNFQNYTLGAFDNTGKPTAALYGFTDK
jgi:arabinogalactan endo-1,4-beta-galactosidase